MDFYEASKKNCACIYKFTFPDDKCYVGRTKNLAKRIELYKRNLSEDVKSSKVIDALREFGVSKVYVEILSEPKNLSDEDKDWYCLFLN